MIAIIVAVRSWRAPLNPGAKAETKAEGTNVPASVSIVKPPTNQ